MHGADSIIYRKFWQKWTTNKSRISFPVQQFQFFSIQSKDFLYVLF